MHDILHHHVLCRYRVVRIDGDTKVDERTMIVENFNTRGVGQVGNRRRPAPCHAINVSNKSSIVVPLLVPAECLCCTRVGAARAWT